MGVNGYAFVADEGSGEDGSDGKEGKMPAAARRPETIGCWLWLSASRSLARSSSHGPPLDFAGVE